MKKFENLGKKLSKKEQKKIKGGGGDNGGCPLFCETTGCGTTACVCHNAGTQNQYCARP